MDWNKLPLPSDASPSCGGIFFYEVLLPDVPAETSLIRVYQVARPLNTEHLPWPMGTSLQNIGRSTASDLLTYDDRFG